MDNSQLEKIVSSLSQLQFKFLGCLSADYIPENIPQNKLLIVNSDNSTSPGTHWMLLANENHELYFGDSLGQSISCYKNLKPLKQTVTYLVTKQLQKSDLCGLYSIYFAYILYRNMTDFDVNDYIIMKFFAPFFYNLQGYHHHHFLIRDKDMKKLPINRMSKKEYASLGFGA